MKSQFSGHFLFLVLLAISASCLDVSSLDTNSTSNETSDSFSEFSNLLGRQAVNLNGRKMTKEVLLENETETLHLIVDSAELKSELEIFDDLDLRQYRVSESYNKEVKNDLTTYRRNGKNGPQEVTIERNSNGSISSIKGHYDESNLLYNSCRKYVLSFESGELTSYEFSGFQKIIFQDTVFFAINAKL